MIDWLNNPGFKVGTEDIYFDPPDQSLPAFFKASILVKPSRKENVS